MAHAGHSNWSVALPATIEAIERHPMVLAVGRAMHRRKSLQEKEPT